MYWSWFSLKKYAIFDDFSKLKGIAKCAATQNFFFLTWNKLRDGGEMKEIVYCYLKNMAAFWTRIVRSDIADIFYFYDNLHFKYFFSRGLDSFKVQYFRICFTFD